MTFIGIPATPIFGNLTSGRSPGEVTIQIKTIASGVSSTSQGFQFNIIPVLIRDRVQERSRGFIRTEYQSGEFETINVGDLEQGQTYTFKATAMNFFGTSGVERSDFVISGK